MAMYTVLLFASCCMGLCSPQLLQPRRIFEKIRALHENSNKLIAREDSMSLYVDISEASKYPLREDLRMRVFNKDSNVTVCDQKMSAYAHIGKFPCTFLASDADLRLGVNHFEFEVYSTLNGRRFASQKIPDIHFFDQYLYEGYYDNFYLTSEFQPYAAKIAVSSLAAVLLAHAIDAGPIALEAEVGSMFGNLVKLPLVAVSTAVIDVSRASTTASVKLFLFFLGAAKNILYALTDGILSAMKGFVHIIGKILIIDTSSNSFCCCMFLSNVCGNKNLSFNSMQSY